MTRLISLADRPVLAQAMGAFNGLMSEVGSAKPVAEVTFTALECFKTMFDHEGPYDTARTLGVLRNGSAADLACEFMGLWNEVGYTCY